MILREILSPGCAVWGPRTGKMAFLISVADTWELNRLQKTVVSVWAWTFSQQAPHGGGSPASYFRSTHGDRGKPEQERKNIPNPAAPSLPVGSLTDHLGAPGNKTLGRG